MIELRRVDPSRNMRRFYRLDVQADLFGGVRLVRQWGRIGAEGQRRAAWYATSPEALVTLELHVRQKLRRGYIKRTSSDDR
jgi:predicted DNA-binding WGR domain protein